MKALEFIFQETQIHFLLGNDKSVMVNATEMAKAFGKLTKNFLRLEETKEFIEILLEQKNIGSDVSRYNRDDIVYSNNKAGTFMTRKLALKFAAWLDPRFELWIFDTIDEILFGNYQKHWEAHMRQEAAKLKMETLRHELLTNGTPETALAYFEQERIVREAKNDKLSAIRSQYKMSFPEQ